MKIFNFLVLVLLISISINSYSYEWTKVDYPNGTQITSILPIDDNVVLAGTGTEMPGTFPSYGVIKSTDSGKSWKYKKNNILKEASVYTIFKTSDGTIYCGLNGSDIYKSTDTAETWVKMNTPLGQIDNFLEADNGNLLALSHTFGSYVSTDKGITWQIISESISKMWGAEKDSQSNVFAIPDNKGVWKSTDNGLTFTDISGTSLTDKNCRSLYVDKNDNIWVACWKNFFFSSDGGSTWISRMNGLESYTGSPKGSIIKQNPVNNDILLGLSYGSVRKYNSQLSKWEIYSSKLAANKITSLAFDSKGKNFVGEFSVGIFTSEDNGINWDVPDLEVGEKMIYELAEYQDNLYVGTGDGMIFHYSSTNNKWKPVLMPVPNPQSFVMGLTVTNAGTVLTARSGTGFSRSTDKGLTWSELYASSKILPEVFYIDSDTIYAGVRGSNPKGVFKSVDDGLTWQKETGEIETKDVFSLTKNLSGDLFAGSGSQGLMKKSAQSGLWTKTSLPENLFIHGLVVNSKNELFVGVANAEGGVYKSTDMGETFTRLDFNEKILAMTIVKDPESEKYNDIFIGTDNDCYFYNSKNEIFEHIPNGYTGKYSRAILYHSQIKKVFAGGMTGGLHSLNLSNTFVEDIFSNFYLSIFPNPAVDYIEISVSNKELQLFAEGEIVQIFDVLGIEVLSVETRHAVSLQHIDVSHLPAGVYFIRFGNKVEKFVKM